MAPDRDLTGWTERPRPPRAVLQGRLVRLEPLDAERHTATQFEAHRDGDPAGARWGYLPYGPFASLEDYRAHLKAQGASEDPMFFAAIDQASGDAVGVLSLMRIDPKNGVIEVGHIIHTPRLAGTAGSTEAIRLLGGLVFDELGYRRFEWKCDNANAPSKRTAERLGFGFESVFHQHQVVKGRNRDTAWFAILDHEWPARRAAFDAWLDPANFDEQGRQRTPLRAR